MRKLLLVVALLLAAAVVAAGILRTGPPPQLEIAPSLPGIGPKTTVRVRASEPTRGLSRVRLELVQGERSWVLLEEAATPRGPLTLWGPLQAELERTVEVGPGAVDGLRSGRATLRLSADRAASWVRQEPPVTVERELPVRLSPPTLSVLSTQTYVRQGGCEAVVYRVGEAASRHGVEAGGRFFAGFALPGGQPGEQFALFAAPYDLADPAAIRLLVADDLGNEARLPFVDHFTARPPSSDTITLSDAFLAKVVPEILANTPEVTPGDSPLASYLEINRNLRRANAEELARLAAASAPAFLWHGPFAGLASGKVMSAFADRRTYVYQGETVDQQDHLGYDLASTRKAPIVAAGTGTVVLARYFGIYGNAVVLDHGYGLQSLYGHLSSIDVTPGQSVVKGQRLGASGETGLAGGDHLHFTMLLGGLPVDPIEWWDGEWIANRIARKLGPALPSAGGS